MKSRRQFISLILTLAMVLTLVPVFGTSVAWADGVISYGLVLDNGKIYQKTGTNKSDQSSAYTGITYNEGTGHWVMNNFNLTTSNKIGIEIYDNLTVLEVEGTNNVTVNTGSGGQGNDALGIYARALTITGSGILNISVTAGNDYSIKGLECFWNNLTVNGVTLNITVGNVTSDTYAYEKKCCGIYVYEGNCTFTDAKVAVAAGTTDKASDNSYGIYTTKDINVIGTDCVITASSINTVGSAYAIYCGSGTKPNANAVDGNGVFLTYDSSKKTYVDADGNTSKALTMFVAHNHDFTYEADGDTITVTCNSTDGGAGCNLPNNKEYITLIGPDDSMYTGSLKHASILGGSDKLESIPDFSDDNFCYYLSDGTTPTTSANSGASAEGKAPVIPGSYVAELTAGGETASIAYDVTKRTWETKPTVNVPDFPIQGYDADIYEITNSAGVTANIKYYYSTACTTSGGTECTAENLNTLSSGTYYAYAVITANDYMDECTTDASEFKVHHVHHYTYEKKSGVTNTIVATCDAEKSTCNDSREIELAIENATYTGIAYKPKGVEKFIQEVGTDTAVTVAYKKGTKDLSSAPVEAGDYTAVMTVSDVAVTADFTICPVLVEKPASLEQQTYTYDGRSKTYKTGSSDYRAVSGSATDVGTYDVAIGLRDSENTRWSDGTSTDLTFTDAFVISPKAITKVTESAVKDYYYTSGYQIYGYEDESWRENYYSADYSITSYYGITVGTYTAIISLNDKENTLWDDGTTSDIAIEFEIQPLEVPVPVADPREFYYTNGTEQTYQAFYQVGDYFYCFDKVFYNITNNTRSAVGTQIAVVTPVENTVWDDGTGTTPKTFDFTIKKEDAYGRIRCLINTEFANDETDKTDGYSYASYMFDIENPSNMYVTTHFKADMYLYPNDASYEIYYTQNPNNLDPSKDKKWSTLKYTDIRVPDGADYTSYYIYAVVSDPDYNTYTTRPYEVFVYSPAVMVATCKKVTIAVEKQKSAKVPLGKRSTVSVPAGTETVYETQNQTVSQRYFSYAPYAGASILRNFDAGAEFANMSYMSNPTTVFHFNNNDHDKQVVRNDFEVPGNFYASLITTKSWVTNKIMFASLQNPLLLMNSFKTAQAIPKTLEVTPSAINVSKLSDGGITTEKLEKYLNGSSILQDYQLFGDEIGYKGIEGFKKGNKATNVTAASFAAFVTDTAFTVTFDNIFITSGAVVTANAIYTTASVKSNSTVAKPEDPVIEDWTFKGWYYVPYASSRAIGAAVNILEDGIPWDFENYPVADNITLYAYWEIPEDEEDPAYNVPVSGEKGKVNTSATVSGNNAEVSNITQRQLEKAGTEGNVVMDLTTLSKSVTEITIPKATFNNIAESEAEGLEIKMPNGTTVVFDNKVLASVAEQAKGTKIKLVVEKDTKAEKTMTKEQKAAIEEMKNPVVFDAYFTSNDSRISDFNGGEADIAAEYQTEYPVRVWYVADDGSKELVPSTYDGKTARFTVTHFSHYVIEQLDGSSYKTCAKDDNCLLAKYTDTVKDDWYHDGVHFCAERKYMNGVSETEFAPMSSLSRAMIVQILWNMEGNPHADYAMSFTDVEADAWYAEAIRWAQSLGIVDGYDDNLFGPDDNVTREQLAKILYSYAAYKKYDVTASEELTEFTDAGLASDWAVSYLQWAKAVKLVSGYGDGRINPTGNATRAEAATMILNFCENVAK